MDSLVIAIKVKHNLSKKIANAIRELRTNILSNKKEYTSILFTSTHAGEGKSTISLCLALSLSHCGKKVVWINCDFHRDNELISIQKKTLGKKENQMFWGLADFLNGSCVLEEIVYPVLDEELAIIPRGSSEKMSCDLFELESFQKLLAELKQKYDYIIIDSSAAGDYVDSRVLAAKCDGVVYVIGYNRTNRGHLQRAAKEIKKCKGTIIGAVINKSKPY